MLWKGGCVLGLQVYGLGQLCRSGCLIHNGTYLMLSLTLTITLTLLTLTVTVRVTLTLLTLPTLPTLLTLLTLILYRCEKGTHFCRIAWPWP